MADRSVATGTRSDSARAMVLQPGDRVPTVRANVAGEAGAGNNDFKLLWLCLQDGCAVHIDPDGTSRHQGLH